MQILYRYAFKALRLRPSGGGFKIQRTSGFSCKTNFNNKIQRSYTPRAFVPFTLGSAFLISQYHTAEQVKGVQVAKFEHQKNYTKSRFPETISKLSQTIRILFRCGFLILLFVPVVILYPITYFGNRYNEWWWKLAIFSLETAGPVFIKLGQWASTRRDIFSEDICNHLTSLQHNVAPHSWQETKSILDHSLGNNWQSYFTDFNETSFPIGSGCVAQVYKVHLKTHVLRSSSKQKLKHEIQSKKISLYEKLFGSKQDAILPKEITVAVKVLHPGIQNKIERDLLILHSFANWLEAMFPKLKWLSLSDCVNVFDDFILRQVDLLQEAALLDKFCSNFENDPLVSFPIPIRPLVTKNVLVETWEQGIPLSHFLINKDNFQESFKKGIANIGIKTLLKMVFKDNLVHADLHPGNILVKFTEQKDGEALKLVFLDCGLASSLSSEDFVNFQNVFKAVAMGNGAKVAQLFLDNSISECQDPNSFTTHMEKLVNDARKATITLSKINVASLLNEVFTLLSTHKVKLEANFLSVILSILVLEGLGRTLDPKLDLLQQAIPYLMH